MRLVFQHFHHALKVWNHRSVSHETSKDQRYTATWRCCVWTHELSNWCWPYSYHELLYCLFFVLTPSHLTFEGGFPHVWEVGQKATTCFVWKLESRNIPSLYTTWKVTFSPKVRFPGIVHSAWSQRNWNNTFEHVLTWFKTAIRRQRHHFHPYRYEQQHFSTWGA